MRTTSYLLIVITLSVGFYLPIHASEYVKLSQINTEQGLNQSNISGLIQDQQGFLWIASQQGLNRYDGYRVTKVASPDNILQNNYVNLVFEDSTGLIWIGAEPDKNYVLNKSTNQLQTFNLPFPVNYAKDSTIFSTIVEGQNQNLWIATFEEIFLYNRQQDQTTFILSLNSLFENSANHHSIRNLLLLENYLLIGTTNGLYGLDLTTKQTKLIRHSPLKVTNELQNNVKILQLNQHGQVLVGTVEGLYRIDPVVILKAASDVNADSSASTLIEQLNIWQIIEKADYYWVATDVGLFKLFKNGPLKFILKFSDTPYNTSDDNISQMIEDREGNLWFGSRSDGVFKWRPNSAIKSHLWQHAAPGYQLSNDMILSTAQTPDGVIWIGTQNGLNRIEPESGKVTQLLVNPQKKETLSGSTIDSMAQNASELWLNTLDGIQVLDLATFQPKDKLFPISYPELFNQSIFNLYFFDQNHLALLNEQGMYVYDLGSNQVSLIESTRTNGDATKSLGRIFNTATGESNSYFVAGADRLVKFSRDSGIISDFHHLPQSNNVRSEPIDLYRDGNQLWVVYPGYGVYLLDANSGDEIQFFSEESLGANSIMDVFPDDLGNLWFSSNDGLARLSTTNFNVRLFDSSDGFATSEFNGGTKLVLNNGDVYLGSIKGAYHITPNEMTPPEKRKVVNYITGLKLLSAKIEQRYANFDDYYLQMQHDDFGLTLEFSALLLNKPKQVKYRYWVEGDNPIKPTLIDRSELFLATLQQGNNRIFVSAIDYETGLESAPASIHIETLPPPWLSNKAYFSYSILFLLLTSVSFYRYRKRHLAKQRANHKIQKSEERLKLALKGSNSGMWDWHSNNDSVYDPRIDFEKPDRSSHVVAFTERLQAIHVDDRDKVTELWLAFLASRKSAFEATYRMKKSTSEWGWYHDLATVSQVDKFDNPIRVTGTYTDITEKKAAIDKMHLFSEAFDNTRDIVFVLDQDKKVVAANQAFYKTTEYKIEAIIGSSLTFISDFKGNRKLISEIFREILLNQHWQGEGQLIRDVKSPLPVVINATGFFDNEQQLQFVFALTDISKQKLAETELRQLANYDALTGLPNRGLLIDRISHAIEHCFRRQQKLAVLFIDLDRFKQINDTLGHEIGDLLLIHVAHTIRRSIRHNDTVARLGGDEFVVVLEDIEDIDAIHRIAQNIIEQMEEPMLLRGNQVTVSPSIGIAIYPDDGEDTPTLLKHADIAMYHAKSAGRNNFQYFKNSMNHAAKKRLDLENKLRQAINSDEFFLVYQPQYDIKNGQLVGMEALARWQPQSGKLISPVEFIPIAEDLGLIVTLTEKLLKEAIRNLSRWHASGINVGLSFNLSASHLNHYDINLYLDELLNKYPINSSLLEFELTESVLMQDIDMARSIFARLAEKNIEIALDDFGTGYSSLKYLNQLPINKLKIDQSFVAQIGTGSENDAIIKTIISLAHSLNLKTVAEGIETQKQLTFLKIGGVDLAQGELFSKPLLLAEIEKLLGAKSL